MVIPCINDYIGAQSDNIFYYADYSNPNHATIYIFQIMPNLNPRNYGHIFRPKAVSTINILIFSFKRILCYQSNICTMSCSRVLEQSDIIFGYIAFQRLATS